MIADQALKSVTHNWKMQENLIEYPLRTSLKPRDTVGKNKNRKKVKLIHSTANVRSIIIFFSCETCGLYFYRDNSLDYLIQSEYIYKTREALVYSFFFFSPNVTSFYLFAPSSYFLFLTYIRSLSFSRSLSHSFIRCFPSVHVSTHLLPFLSLFLLFLARVFSNGETGNTSETVCETRFCFHESIVSTDTQTSLPFVTKFVVITIIVSFLPPPNLLECI